MNEIFIGLTLFYVILFCAEHRWPLRKPTCLLRDRIVINFVFTGVVYLVAFFVVRPVLYYHFYFVGLVSRLPLGHGARFVLGFLLLDLTFYYWHWLNHRVPLLWRFHNVHHTDPDLDVTTSMRFHCVEIAYSAFFRLLQLMLLGVTPLTLILYETFFQANTFFHHSNFRLPLRLEKVLNFFWVTPRMHGIHHSNYRNETNSNYGVIFTFWDRVHRTLNLRVSQKDITIGVPGYPVSENKLRTLLFMPFKKQKTYWPENRYRR